MLSGSKPLCCLSNTTIAWMIIDFYMPLCQRSLQFEQHGKFGLRFLCNDFDEKTLILPFGNIGIRPTLWLHGKAADVITSKTIPPLSHKWDALSLNIFAIPKEIWRRPENKEERANAMWNTSIVCLFKGVVLFESWHEVHGLFHIGSSYRDLRPFSRHFYIETTTSTGCTCMRYRTFTLAKSARTRKFSHSRAQRRI